MKFKYICTGGDATSHYEVKDCLPITVKCFIDHFLSNHCSYTLSISFAVSNNIYEKYSNRIEFKREGISNYKGKWFIESQKPIGFQEKFNEKKVVKAYYSSCYGYDDCWLILEDE